MKRRSDNQDDQDSLRRKLLGLGDKSVRKSYYPELQARLTELERFRALLNESTDAILTIDAATMKLVEANQSAARMLEISQPELAGRQVDGLMLWDGPSPLESLREAGGGKGSPSITGNCRFKAAGGGRIPVEFTARRVEFDDRPYVVFVGRDITERLTRFEEIRESERRFRQIVEKARAGYFFLDREGLIQDVNQAWLNMHHYSSAREVVGRHFSLFADPSVIKDWRESMDRLLGGDTLQSGESSRITRDGLIQYHHFSAWPVERGGEITGVEGFIIDSTERKLAEEALERRILALTRPLDQTETIAFEDMFNLEEIQTLQDQFALATGVASIITLPDGVPLTRPSNFCRLCIDIIRATEKGLKNCYRSDAVIGRQKSDGPVIQPCLSGGLWDAGASITVGGRHVANWLIGQVRDETQNEDALRAYAREIEADEDEVVQAFREVPAMSREKFRQVADALYSLAGQLSSIAYQNIQQARFISERKRAETELRNKTEELDRFFQNTLDLLVIADMAGKFLRLNPQWSKTLGYDLEELEGSRYLDYVHPDDIEGTLEAMALLSADYEIRNYLNRFQCKDGSYRWLEWRSFPVGNMVYATARDITERLESEQAVRRSEEKFRSLFNSMTEAAVLHEVVHDRTGRAVDYRILDCNPAFLKMAGQVRERVVGELASRIYGTGTAPYLDTYAQVAETGEPASFEVYFQPMDRYFIISAFATGPGRFATTSLDVTQAKKDENERKVLEIQLRQSQKMEALGTLAGGMAHDFNNILGVIIGYSEVVRDNAAGNPEIAASISQVLGAAERAGALVKKILTFGRKMDSDQKPVSLNRCVRHTREILEHTLPKMIEISTHLAPELPLVLADANQMEQILLNLATNAADAMEEGGKLSIETQALYLGDEYCRQHLDLPSGHYVELLVSDTGHGMNEATREQIFNPFFTTKGIGKGTGLGLSTVYGLVKDHRGHIYCYSEPGRGTAFKIYLPVHREIAQDTVEPAVMPESTPGRGETILLVDDEDALRELISQTLVDLGYRTLTAASGEEALEIYDRTYPKPDLVVMDVSMPGMGGFKCMQALLERDPEIKVVVSSGYSANGQLRHCLEEGARSFLAKPFRRVDLLTIIRRVLDH